MTEPPGWLLAIDTASRLPSVALLRQGHAALAREGSGEPHHAESLLPLIDAALAEAGLGIAGVHAFAIAIGPGGFTSLRVGLATVKGLAFGSSCPVAAVSTLAAQAWQHAGALPVASLLDARRGELYAAVYEGCGEAFRALVPEAIHTPESLAPHLPARCRVVGDDPAGGRLRELRGEGIEIAEPARRPRAVAVAELGLAALARGESVGPDALAPRYLRRPQAEEARGG